ncbi:MAG: hypothetical protein ABR540_21025 [Acidimicrobiales bacterium]
MATQRRLALREDGGVGAGDVSSRRCGHEHGRSAAPGIQGFRVRLAWAYFHCPIAVGAEHPAYTLFAHILESILPLTESFGIATAEELDPATYALRLRDEMIADDAVACCAPVVGAWARTRATGAGERVSPLVSGDGQW